MLASWDPPRLVVIDLGAPVIRGGVYQTWYWPMYAYNPERQGCLACGSDAVVSVPEAPGPTGAVRFAPPMPNPSGGPVALAFELPARAAVSLTVYDVAGRRVRELVGAELGAGPHRASWTDATRAGWRWRPGCITRVWSWTRPPGAGRWSTDHPAAVDGRGRRPRAARQSSPGC